jgi:hypothetical protein
MEAVVIDLEAIRQARTLKRLRECESFGKLPCPCCDAMTVPVDVSEGRARFICDNGGQHEPVSWVADDLGVVFDHRNRARHYFTY